MTNISATQVKKLREKTGLGLMDCKKALQESSGDIQIAIENLRKSSALKAEKKSSRSAIEGVIQAEFNEKNNQVILVEVNCETDFVSKDSSFLDFCDKTLALAIKNHFEEDLFEIVAQKMEEERRGLIQRIGENIIIRKIIAHGGGVVDYYVHSNKKLASIVSLSSGNKELAKDIAMHITALNPLVIAPEDLSEELITKEKEIIHSQVAKEDKPPEIVEKMVQGRLNKYLSEVSLIKQRFVKEPNTSIEDLLSETNSKIESFVRIEVGEGIEVEEIDFASEVMAQIESI